MQEESIKSTLYVHIVIEIIKQLQYEITTIFIVAEIYRYMKLLKPQNSKNNITACEDIQYMYRRYPKFFSKTAF